MDKNIYSIITVAIVSFVTILLRGISFIAFKNGKEVPPFIKKLGNLLPYGIMGLLVVYCLKDTAVMSHPYGIPELISVSLVVAIQAWKRNSLVSVLVGTACYMILIRTIF